jgi:hypothetical protein
MNSRQRWGTFSVVDHLSSDPFVADVLLYDQLVIPVPADGNDRERWEKIGRNPSRLEACLKILGPLAQPVSWGDPQRETFKTRFAATQAVAFDTSNIASMQAQGGDPLYLTRVLLTKEFLPELPPDVTSVLAVAAYPSRSACQKEVPFTVLQNPPSEAVQARRERLGYLLRYRFLVPSGDGRADMDLLREAVDLATKDDFQKKRAVVHNWQEDIISKGIPDDRAIREMENFLKDYTKYMQGKLRKGRWRWAHMLASAGLGLGLGVAAVAVPMVAVPAGLAATTVGAAAPIAQFVLFDRDESTPPGESATAAMFYSAQRVM